MGRRSLETAMMCNPGKGVYGRVITRTHGDFDNQPWMLANVSAQCDWLLSQKENRREVTVFLDNDIIVRQAMPELPDDADIYVTWRDNVGDLSKAQPYNYGVVIVRHTIPAMRAMMWLEDRVSKMAPRHQKWYGNQIALREMVGPLKRNETVIRTLHNSVPVKIHQLPCHKFNWSPPADRLRQNAGDKVFIHLKGDRKEAFDYYWNKVMSNEK